MLSGPFAGQIFNVPRGKLLIVREKDCQLRLESELVRHY
jgi:hypothetical protein